MFTFFEICGKPVLRWYEIHILPGSSWINIISWNIAEKLEEEIELYVGKREEEEEY